LIQAVRNLLYLLGPKGRKDLRSHVVLSCLAELGSLAGLSSVIPFMALVARPDYVREVKPLSFLYELGGFASVQSFLAVTGVVTFFCLFLSNGLAALETWQTARFLGRWRHEFSRRLLEAHLKRDYLWFTSQKTAVMTRQIERLVKRVVDGCLMSLSRILVKGFTASLILIGLCLIDTRVAGALLVVYCVVYFLIFGKFRDELRRFGREANQLRKQQFRHEHDILAGIKETKTYNCEALELEVYSGRASESERLEVLHRLRTSLPDYIVQTTSAGLVVALVVFLLLTEQEMSRLVPLFTLYVIASTRLMPAIRQVFAGAAKLQNQGEDLQELCDEIRATDEAVGFRPPSEIPRLVFEKGLELKNVSFAYPNASRASLDDVSFTLHRGEKVAIVGPNGAGKTTLLHMIAGLFPQDSGEFSVDGTPLNADRIDGWQRNLGFVPQEPHFLHASVKQNIAYSRGEIDRQLLRRAVKLSGVDALVDDLPKGLKTKVGDRGNCLSGGERQRVALARAYYRQPEVLILDEATSEMDGKAEAELMGAIPEGLTVLVSAQRLSSVENFDRLILMENGRITATGTYPELLEKSALFRAMAGQD
jgi:ABC-type multidrug transport system fused ATPase/permease subunit